MHYNFTNDVTIPPKENTNEGKTNKRTGFYLTNKKSLIIMNQTQQPITTLDVHQQRNGNSTINLKKTPSH